MSALQSPSGFPSLVPMAVDFALSETGDILIDSTGDFQTTQGVAALLQEITVRLKTVQGDNWIVPLCGASLNLLIGQPNGPAIETQAQALIERALTYDGLFTSDQITVDAYPTSETQIILLVTCDLQGKSGISPNEQDLTLALKFDLQEGLLT